VWKIFLIPLFDPGIAVEEQGPFPRSQLARILITVAPLVSGLLKNSSQPMAIYVRRKNGAVWHSCRNCSKFPTASKVIVRATKPADAEFCKECQSKAVNGR